MRRNDKSLNILTSWVQLHSRLLYLLSLNGTWEEEWDYGQFIFVSAAPSSSHSILAVWHWLFWAQRKLLAPSHRSHLCSSSTLHWKALDTNPIYPVLRHVSHLNDLSKMPKSSLRIHQPTPCQAQLILLLPTAFCWRLTALMPSNISLFSSSVPYCFYPSDLMGNMEHSLFLRDWSVF